MDKSGVASLRAAAASGARALRQFGQAMVSAPPAMRQRLAQFASVKHAGHCQAGATLPAEAFDSSAAAQPVPSGSWRCRQVLPRCAVRKHAAAYSWPAVPGTGCGAWQPTSAARPASLHSRVADQQAGGLHASPRCSSTVRIARLADVPRPGRRPPRPLCRTRRRRWRARSGAT